MNVGSLQVKQLALDVESAAIAAQRSSGGDDAMAGNNDGDRIPIVGHADSAEGMWVSDGAGDIAVAASLAVGDREERLPAGKLKRGSAEVERHRKFATLAAKVLFEFANVGRKLLFGLAKLKSLGVHLHHARFKLQAHQPFCRSGQKECPDGRGRAKEEQFLTADRLLLFVSQPDTHLSPCHPERSRRIRECESACGVEGPLL